MHDLDLPRGDARELVIDRDRVYELNGEDSRTLAGRNALDHACGCAVPLVAGNSSVNDGSSARDGSSLRC